MSNYWIQTFTGKRFDLLEPTEDMICIEDIAHHLSIENRFHGATRFAYSVGYHSVLAAQQAEDFFKLEALMHDAHEAYYKDLATDLKSYIDSANNIYSTLTLNFDRLLDQKFGMDLLSLHLLSSEVDIRMCKTEKELLLVNGPAQWRSSVMNAKPYDLEILKLQPEKVEELFLKEYEKWRRN